MNMPHRRAITKKNRPTWASWKKASAVWWWYPDDRACREMGLKEMTGFVKTAFDILKPPPAEAPINAYREPMLIFDAGILQRVRTTHSK